MDRRAMKLQQIVGRLAVSEGTRVEELVRFEQTLRSASSRRWLEAPSGSPRPLLATGLLFFLSSILRVVCFCLNCYGRKVISFRGGAAKFGQTPRLPLAILPLDSARSASGKST